ncbi:MAG: AAA family ATPase, partial [Gammaproteobacteria bacterium]|nr:AAA family ATPase [Gammaproteobacteria bacterium]
QLLQGPPGTGKTTTIVAIAHTLVEKKERILICAPSNKAAQVIAERLLKKLPKIRVALAGVEKKLNPGLRSIFVHTWARDRKTDLNEIIASIKEMYLNAAYCEKIGYSDLYYVLSVRLIQIKKEFQEFIKLTQHAAPSLLNRFYFEEIEAEIEKIEEVSLLLNNAVSQDEIQKYYLAQKKQEIARNFPELNENNRKNSRFNKKPPKMPEVVVQTQVEELIAKPTVLGDYESQLNKISNMLTTLKAHFPAETDLRLLNDAHIVICTLSVSGRSYLFQMKKVDTVIVDEAGQAVEAETLIAFQHLNTIRPKVLLVGDVKQLPATVFSEEAKKYHYDWSLLERLQVVNQQSHILLDVQYRMDPRIRAFPSERFYDDKLTDGENIATRPAPAFANDPYISGFKLVNVDGYEERSGKSFYNAAECDGVYNILNYLVEHDYVTTKTTVGVISFYMGQVRALKETLTPFFDKMDLSVGTVDGFQGEECDIVIISTVRANRKKKVGFTDDFRRINVALTRPKYALITLVNVSTFENQLTDFAALIEKARALDKHVFYHQDDFKPMLALSRPNTYNTHYSNPAQKQYSKSSPNISAHSQMISQYGMYHQPRQNKLEESYVPQVNITVPKIIDHTSEDDFPSLTAPTKKKNDLKFSYANTLKTNNTLSTPELSHSAETKKPLSKKQRQLKNKNINFYSMPDQPSRQNNNAAINRNNNFSS